MDMILKPLFNLGVMGLLGGLYWEIFDFEGVFFLFRFFFVSWIAVKIWRNLLMI